MDNNWNEVALALGLNALFLLAGVLAALMLSKRLNKDPVEYASQKRRVIKLALIWYVVSSSVLSYHKFA